MKHEIMKISEENKVFIQIVKRVEKAKNQNEVMEILKKSYLSDPENRKKIEKEYAYMKNWVLGK